MDDLTKVRAEGALKERAQIVDELKRYRAEVTVGIPAHVAFAFGEIVDGAIKAVTELPVTGMRPDEMSVTDRLALQSANDNR